MRENGIYFNVNNGAAICEITWENGPFVPSPNCRIAENKEINIRCSNIHILISTRCFFFFSFLSSTYTYHIKLYKRINIKERECYYY